MDNTTYLYTVNVDVLMWPLFFDNERLAMIYFLTISILMTILIQPFFQKLDYICFKMFADREIGESQCWCRKDTNQWSRSWIMRQQYIPSKGLWATFTEKQTIEFHLIMVVWWVPNVETTSFQIGDGMGKPRRPFTITRPVLPTWKRARFFHCSWTTIHFNIFKIK